MSKKQLTITIIIIVILAATGGVVWYLKTQKQERVVQNEENQSPQNEVDIDNIEAEVITTDVDTSDWLIYRNEKLGITVKHPKNFLFREGNKFEVDVIGCYLITSEEGDKFCDNKGNVYFKLYNEFHPLNSLEGFDYIYTKYKKARAEFNIGPPRLLSLKQISIGNNKDIYYQAQYFGGDGYKFEVYIPTTQGLLVYNYSVAPIENDAETIMHEQVAKAILLSLRLDILR